MKETVKRGQAAMELLITYGWAILVVLAAIGALAHNYDITPNIAQKNCFNETRTKICQEQNGTLDESTLLPSQYSTLCKMPFTREKGNRVKEYYLTDEEVKKCEELK